MTSKTEKIDVWNKINSPRISINLVLLSIDFTIFTFIIAVKPELFLKNLLIPLQVILSIPLIMSSSFAHSKQIYDVKIVGLWDTFGHITFVAGYAFIINVVGMLVASLVSLGVAMIFFAGNILLALTYSLIEIHQDREKMRARLYKDIPFFALILLLGILPSLGFY